MPTPVTLTVKPSGGDYTLLSAAVAAIPSDIVATDENYIVECDTFSGGLSDGFDFPSITTDATRDIVITAAAGHEYNYSDDSGFFVTAFRNFNGAVRNNNTGFVSWIDIGLKNTGTSSATGFASTQPSQTITRVTAVPSGNFNCFNLNNATSCTVEECLAVGGNIGYRTNNSSNGTITNCASIDASSEGYQRGTSSNNWTIKNSLYIGSGSWTNNSGWNAASDYNAASDTSAVGSNSLQNRTTADLVDYANDDYRTASGSALATAGEGGTFIGFALEAASGISITEQLKNINYTSLDPVITLTGGIQVTEQLKNISYQPLNPVITLTGVISVVEQTKNIQYQSLDPVIDLTGVVEVTEQTVSINYQAINPTITLTPKPIEIIESLATIQYQSLNPSILLTPEPIGIVSTVCFNGIIIDLEFDGTQNSLQFNGTLENLEYNGSLTDLEFNGTIKVNCIDGDIKTDC